MAQQNDVKILVVDDEADLVDVIVQQFKIFGFQAYFASSGNQAWDLAQKQDFDIIITDVRMADGTGVDLLRNIRQRDPKHPSVYFISGFTDLSNEDMYDLGADGVFHKPFSATAIRDAIRHSMLVLDQRWRQRREFQIAMEIQRQVPSLSELHGVIGIGRGGLFIKSEGEYLQPDEYCRFAVDVDDSQPVNKISGVGRVVWVRSASEQGRAVGYGLEIEHLDSECLVPYARWVRDQKILPYIPKG